MPTDLFHSHSVLLLRIPLLQSLNTIAEQWHTHLLAHTPAKCSTHPRIGSSRVDATTPAVPGTAAPLDPADHIAHAQSEFWCVKRTNQTPP